MHALPLLPLAASFPWLNLVWVLVGITVFVCAVAALGHYLASTHPDAAPGQRPVAAPAPAGPVAAPANQGLAPDVAVVVAAAVYAALGESARITSVVPVQTLRVNVDSLMQMWSLEGRREIYSSHRVR